MADSPAQSPEQMIFVPYEKRLDAHPAWAEMEGDRHFSENSYVFKTLRKLVGRVQELGIPYAVLGDLAMFRHGYRRYTEVVELLLTRQDLRTVHDRLIGDGYVLDRPHSKTLRDVEFGVKILFQLTEEYAGDGNVMPIKFPHPNAAAVELNGVSIARLETLVEVKLAAGASSLARLRQTADVQDLIYELDLPAQFANGLNPHVQSMFLDLVDTLRVGTRELPSVL